VIWNKEKIVKKNRDFASDSWNRSQAKSYLATNLTNDAIKQPLPLHASFISGKHGADNNHCFHS